jgi:murein lipoprotein
MKHFFQIIILTFIIALASGCANTQLEEEVAALKAQLADVSVTASEANERSKAAEATADSAQASANRAEQTAENTNSKLDRMFKKSMMK